MHLDSAAPSPMLFPGKPLRWRELIAAMADALADTGRNIVMGRLKGGVAAGQPGAAEPNQLAWGTGTTAAVRTQGALIAEAAEARVTTTSSLIASGSSGALLDTYRAVGTMTNNIGTVSKPITEAGLFDAPKAASAATPVGNIFLRSDFAVINVSASDSVQLQWDWRLT